MKNDSLALDSLLKTITRLRAEDGCPWDIKQTPSSLKKYLKEEVSELLEAITNDDLENVCEEIGDVVYVLAMIAEIHREKNTFTFADCLNGITAKLIRRHPHVFENKPIANESELREQWENIKKTEKKRNN